jgi:hypothetical protein
MAAPVCVRCSQRMVMTEVGREVLQLRRNGTPQQAPYLAFSGDEFLCKGCNARVVVHNPRPFWQQHEGNFEKVVKADAIRVRE